MPSRMASGGVSADWPEVAVRASPLRMLAALFGLVLFAVGGAVFAFRWVPGVEIWSIGWLVGWLTVIFFAPLAVLAGLKLARIREASIRAGPWGVHIGDLSPDWVPWSAITDISVHPDRLFLLIDPVFDATMSLTPSARWNRAMGLDEHPHEYRIFLTALSRTSVEVLRQAVEAGLARTRHP